MKILLLGEYSRLHNSLKEGLVLNGYEVFLAGYGDDFKDFPLNLKFKNKYHSGIWLLVKKVIYRITRIDLQSLYTKNFIFKNKNVLMDYDVVQLINENTFNTLPAIEIEILKFLFKNNKKVFLLSCGTDYTSVKYAFEKKLRYSILTPFFEKKMSFKKARPILNYISDEHKPVHDFLYNNVNGIIASDIDYHLPLIEHKNYLGMIPNPVNIDTNAFQQKPILDRIIIFHGINTVNYHKKGHDIFEAALNTIQKKYPHSVEIITVKSLPYKQYINSYNRAHIVLDQVYSYDQGYNALEAMAKGKVVFTGAEKEWCELYKIKEDSVAINALPEVNHIISKLEWLIQNPQQISIIAKNARKFVEEHHHYKDIAKTYLKTWNS